MKIWWNHGERVEFGQGRPTTITEQTNMY